MILRELAIRLGFDIDHSVGDALLVMNQVNEAVDKLRDTVVDFVKEVAAKPMQLAAFSHQLGILSETTGLSADTLQVLGEAAELTGSSLQALATGFRAMSMHAEAAREGNNEASLSFAQLGVHVTDAQGHLKPTEELFAEIGDALAKIPNKAERMAAAVKVLGRGAFDLLPILGKGKEYLAGLREEMEATGNFLTTSELAGLQQLHDVSRFLSKTWEGLVTQAALGVIPALVEMKREAEEFWKANSKAVQEKVREGFHWLAESILAVVHAGKMLLEHWKVTLAVLAALRLALWLYAGASLAAGAASLTAAADAAAAWLIAFAPIAAILAGIALLILILDDLWGSFHGKKGVVLGLWALFRDQVVESAKTLDKAMSEAFEAVGRRISKFADDVMKGTFGKLLNLMLTIMPGGQLIAATAGAIGGAFPQGIGASLQNDVRTAWSSNEALRVLGGGGAPAATSSVLPPQIALTFNLDNTVHANSSDPNAIKDATGSVLEQWMMRVVEETHSAVSAANGGAP